MRGADSASPVQSMISAAINVTLPILPPPCRRIIGMAVWQATVQDIDLTELAGHLIDHPHKCKSRIAALQ